LFEIIYKIKIVFQFLHPKFSTYLIPILLIGTFLFSYPFLDLCYFLILSHVILFYLILIPDLILIFLLLFFIISLIYLFFFNFIHHCLVLFHLNIIDGPHSFYCYFLKKFWMKEDFT
jgi:hypothetical protein